MIQIFGTGVLAIGFALGWTFGPRAFKDPRHGDIAQGAMAVAVGILCIVILCHLALAAAAD